MMQSNPSGLAIDPALEPQSLAHRTPETAPPEPGSHAESFKMHS